MKEFMMIFRSEDRVERSTPEEMESQIKHWQDWIGSIAAQGKFVSTNALGMEGKIVKANNVITDGPFMEVKEMVGGYIIVKSDTIEDAIKLSEGCPTLDYGGTVEIRDVLVF